jgi:hypothetical protein
VGYVGLATPGPEVNFPSLFPLLIAGTSFVTQNYEWAGRVVSLVLGTLLPLPVFGIAALLFNRRVGFIAALLVSLHPLLVNLSFAVLSEGHTQRSSFRRSMQLFEPCMTRHLSYGRWRAQHLDSVILT